MSSEDEEWPEGAEPSEEELAEAAALMVALERGHDGGAPDEALESAHLLAFAADGTLSQERADAVLSDVLAHARRPEAAPKRRWWQLLVPTSLVAAAAAVAVVMLQPPATLPSPSLAVLRAQAEAASGVDGQALDEAMGEYRQQLYAALEDGN